MKIVVLGLIVAFFVPTEALFRCWSCDNQPSLEACRENGKLTTCQESQRACETHVRRNGRNFLYFKQCKQVQACRRNEIQNAKIQGSPAQCNNKSPNSVCRCCCYADKCGSLTEDCPARIASTAREPSTTPAATPLPEVFCVAPEFWEEGEIDCGQSRPDGTYDLRHRCKYMCGEGTRIVEGNKDFTVCRRDSEDSSKTLWRPAPPPCEVANIEERCLTPPMLEQGRVQCQDQRPGGGWNVGDICTFFCPEDYTLVGSEITVCQPSFDSFSEDAFTFFPNPPCCEPPCESSRPAEILFILDHSVSIGRENWDRTTQFVADLIGEFDPKFVKFAVIVFGFHVLEERTIRFDNQLSVQELQEKILSMDYSPPGNGTYTIEALNYAAEEDLGDDETVPNFTVFIGDGDATDSEETGLFDENLDIAAEGLRSKSKAIYAIDVSPENTDPVYEGFESTIFPFFDILEGLEIIASLPDFVLTFDDFEILLEYLRLDTMVLCEPICSFYYYGF